MKNYKKNKSSKSKNKYAFGGVAQDKLNEYLKIQSDRVRNKPNMIESPDTAITNNEIAQAKAQLASNNGVTKTLDFLGNAGLAIGGGMVNKAIDNGESPMIGADKEGKGGFNIGALAKMGLPILQGAGMGNMFAMGGVANNVQINAEGGEMIKTPGQESMEIEGNSHANGGVDMQVPEGSIVYSKQLQKEEKSMADRERMRQNYLKRLQAQLEKNPGDKIVKKTYDIARKNAAMQEQEDIASMEKARLEEEYDKKGANTNTLSSVNRISDALSKTKQKYADGGLVTTQDPPTKRKNFLSTYDEFGNPIVEQEKDEYQKQADIYNNMFSPRVEINNQKKIDNRDDEFAKLQAGVDGDLAKMNQEEEDAKLAGYKTSLLTPPTMPVDKSPFDSNGEVKQDKSKMLLDSVNGYLKSQNGITSGDALGLYGMYRGATDQMKNTLANRAGDTANQNFYKDFGKAGIKGLEASKQNLAAQKDLALQEAQNQYSNVSSARSANVANALRIAEQGGKNANMANAKLNYAGLLSGINAQIANSKNQQDQIVMQGEESRVTKDQMDRDNFNKQYAKDIETKNFGTQKIAGVLNDIKERNVNSNLINQIHNDFGINAMTGQVKRKAIENVDMNKEFYNDIPKENAKTILSNPDKYIVKENKLFDKSGVELDKKTLQPIANANVTPNRPMVNTDNFSNGIMPSTLKPFFNK